MEDGSNLGALLVGTNDLCRLIPMCESDLT